MISTLGIPEQDRAEASRIYWSAFGSKLGHVLGPAERAIPFLQETLRLENAVCAHGPDGRLLGLAGFKTPQQSFLDIQFGKMRAAYGLWGATWRLALLALLDGEVDNKRFLMDGIAVSEDSRGSGVGTALLEGIFREAMTRGYREVRLEVVDSNPRAKALYERRGFDAGGVKKLGWLKHIYGFNTATTMVRKLA